VPEFYVMIASRAPRFAMIQKHNEALENFTAPALGNPLGDAWPDGLEYRMAANAKGMEIADLIPNTLGYTMMSERLKTLIAERSKAKVEWLRFTLLNHKGRKAADNLWVANVLTLVDAIDRERTVGEPYPAKPEWYLVTDQLYIRPEKVDAKLDMFRLGEMPRRIIVRDDLKAAIEKAGMTGVLFHEMGAKVELR
jgi:hypothetical protein